MHISTQLYIGAHEQQQFSLAQIAKKIATAKKYAHVQQIMFWNEHITSPLTHDIIRCCKDYGIAVYMWFPMLADIPGYASQETDLVVSYAGKRGYGELGRWEQLGQGAETFRFICPNNTPALNQVFEIYRKLLDQLDVDGVFLDRIRYPSFSNGLESLFTCFCEFCQQKFSEWNQESLNEYRSKIADALAFLKSLSAGQLAEYDTIESLWQSAGLADFFAFRNRNIFDVVQRFSDEAKSRGKAVGLDVFTPSFAPSVAQDYRLLSSCSDWLKPMIYCHALGPAGIPLELACFLQAMVALCPNISEAALTEFGRRILGVALPNSIQGIRDHGIPADVIAKEMQKIRNAQLSQHVKIYAGIEAVDFPPFVTIDEPTLRACLSQLDHQADGFVASWNLLYIPDTNLQILGNAAM